MASIRIHLPPLSSSSCCRGAHCLISYATGRKIGCPRPNPSIMLRFGWAACALELPSSTLISAVVHTILATRHCRQPPPMYERDVRARHRSRQVCLSSSSNEFRLTTDTTALTASALSRNKYIRRSALSTDTHADSGRKRPSPSLVSALQGALHACSPETIALPPPALPPSSLPDMWPSPWASLA